MTARRVFGIALTAWLCAAAAGAQPVGTFRWQLQPYCNVVTVAVTQVGAIYTLDGTDDQCGAATRAAVVGTAFPNPDGSIGLGLHVVGTPGGTPAHVDATVTLPAAGGSWRDSAGHSGAFMLVAGPGSGGSPRPAGSVGAAAINSAEVQRRVVGACPAGQAMQSVAQDGAVTCGATGAGTLTGVTAGTGLAGGGTSGAVTLAVQFGGTGTATTAARSDHVHGQHFENTHIGLFALDSLATQASAARNTAVGSEALRALTLTSDNTAMGAQALKASTTGSANTAIGSRAMTAVTTGLWGVGVGYQALMSAIGSTGNTGLGARALELATSGDVNTAVGFQTLADLTTGANNVALGAGAGAGLTTGSGNVYINAEPSTPGETNTIRVGHLQTAAYMKGIYGSAVNALTDQLVVIDAGGKLGTVVSSGRFKEDVRPIAGELARLQQLRPVSYRYKPDLGRGDGRQYGLIAEEVRDVMPELAVIGADGQAESVRYQVLTPLLVAEVQRLEGERRALVARIEALERLVRTPAPR